MRLESEKHNQRGILVASCRAGRHEGDGWGVVCEHKGPCYSVLKLRSLPCRDLCTGSLSRGVYIYIYIDIYIYIYIDGV